MIPEADATFPSATQAPADGAAFSRAHTVSVVFEERARPVAVVVKRKRVLLEAPGSPSATPGTDRAEAGEGDRKPRVFVVPAEPRPQDVDAAPVNAAAAEPEPTPVVRALRRRPSPLQRPGKVVHIVLAPAEPQAPADAEPQADEWLPLPPASEYQAVLASLAHVKTLIDEASAARRFRFDR
jgi:hypothetical protein